MCVCVSVKYACVWAYVQYSIHTPTNVYMCVHVHLTHSMDIVVQLMVRCDHIAFVIFC